ncbi:MAG: GldG family protein [Clostridiales bacterium]|nr:GldG family protein [Clostridiales bacterium]
MSFRSTIDNILSIRRNRRMIKDRRSASLKRYAIGSVILLIGIIIVFNMIVGLLVRDFKIDFSATKMTSLSDETRKVLSELSSDVEIVGLFEKPENLQNSVYQPFIPILEEYQAVSGGKVSVSYHDPTSSPSVVFSLDPTGSTQFSEGTYVIRSNDRISVIDPYTCLAFDSYEYSVNNRYVVVGNRIEAVFTGTISYLTSSDLQKVYFMRGHGEPEYSTVAELLRYDGYDCYDLYLDEEGAVPEDCDLIVLNLPQTDITTVESQLLSEYLSSGGRIMVVCDFLSVNTQMNNLYALTEIMGISLSTDLILEYSPDHLFKPENNRYSKGIVSTEYASDFGINYVTVGWARNVRIMDASKEGLSVAPIITSSSEATINPYGMQDAEKVSEGVYNYAVRSVNGPSGNRGAMIVFGTGFLTADEYLAEIGATEDNTLFLRNLVRSLSGRDIAAPIPPKELPSYAFTDLPSVSRQTIWSVVLIAVLPFVFFSAGLIVYYRRRNK